jgi:hypothetical protein
MDFDTRVSLPECSIQAFHKISADNVFKFLWLGPMVETEDLIMKPAVG